MYIFYFTCKTYSNLIDSLIIWITCCSHCTANLQSLLVPMILLTKKFQWDKQLQTLFPIGLCLSSFYFVLPLMELLQYLPFTSGLALWYLIFLQVNIWRKHSHSTRNNTNPLIWNINGCMRERFYFKQKTILLLSYYLCLLVMS